MKPFVHRVLFAAFASLIGAFFALPLLWLVFAPFDESPSLSAAVPRPPTLSNFGDLSTTRKCCVRSATLCCSSAASSVWC